MEGREKVGRSQRISNYKRCLMGREMLAVMYNWPKCHKHLKAKQNTKVSWFVLQAPYMRFPGVKGNTHWRCMTRLFFLCKPTRQPLLDTYHCKSSAAILLHSLPELAHLGCYNWTTFSSVWPVQCVLQVSIYMHQMVQPLCVALYNTFLWRLRNMQPVIWLSTFHTAGF